jgi:hypothetical protein
MTPDAIRCLSQVRQEFYSLFAAAMDVPVKITNRNSQASSPSVSSWFDSRQRLNYLYIFAHTAPDDFIPERPLVLRLTVNKGGDLLAISRQKKISQELNHHWHLELLLLPEEALDFLPWVVSLVKSHDTHSGSSTLLPPYPLDLQGSTVTLFPNIRTQSAHSKLLQQASTQLSRDSDLNLSPAKRFG